MRTDKYPVMVVDDILHSHSGLQTCVVTGKKLLRMNGKTHGTTRKKAMASLGFVTV